MARSEPGIADARFDLEAAYAWLAEAPIREDGSVLSWVNPEHPGYDYPEAAGLWLTLFSQYAPERKEARERVANALVRAIAPSGGVGRGESRYLFDTAIALAGLQAHRRAGGRLLDESAPARLASFIDRALAQGRAVQGGAEAGRDRWSTRPNCHHLKLAILQRVDAPVDPALLDSFVGERLSLHGDGCFESESGAGGTYVHAECYALEGLLELATQRADAVEPLTRGAAWLASLQTPHGSLPAWQGQELQSMQQPADVVAQAVRIWAALDPQGHATQIERGVARLGQLQAPSGGVAYEPGSNDLNTWCTVFAVQAIEWVRRGRGTSWIA